MADRLSGVEAPLHNVQQLANATAKGVGKDRAQRQQVCFCQGGFRAAVEEALQRWQDGAREVKAEGAGSASTAAPANRPTPFKFQFFKLLVGQLETQGLDEQVARGLKDLRVEETVEALQFREPPDDVSKTWVIVLLFRATWSGYSAWTLLSSPTVRQVVAKRDGCSKILATPPKRSGAGSRGARGALERVEANGEVDLRSVVLQPGCLLWRGVTKSVKLLGLYYVLFVVFYRMWSMVPSTDLCLRPVPSG